MTAGPLNISLNTIVQSLTVPTFVIDTRHRVVAWNRACEMLTGIQAKDILGTTDSWRGFYKTPRPCLADIVLNGDFDDLDQWYASHGESKFSRGLHAENWFEDINGTKRYLIFDAEPLYDDQGNLIGALENLEDVTELKSVELLQRSLMERLMLSDRVFTYTDQAILITDAQNRIIAVNQAFTRLTGYTQQEILRKTPAILASGRHGPEFYAQMWHSLLSEGHWEGEVWDRKKDGSVYPKWLSINTVHDNNAADPTHFIAIFSDISERKKDEAFIQHIAFHDMLTGLPNRLLLKDRLQQAILDAHRSHSLVALMFLDLDHFKQINDTLGHQIGDLLLQEVAKRLRECVRETDTVARLGGDEFVIVLSDLPQRDVAGKIADKILASLGHPMQLQGHEISAPPSIGIAVCPDDGSGAEALMQRADDAMYQAKQSGRNNYRYFTPEASEIASQAE